MNRLKKVRKIPIHVILSVSLICLTMMVRAQEVKSSCSFYTAFTDPETKKVIFRTAEEMPQFEHLEQDIRSYINESIQKYADQCTSSTITISFIVQPDGKITGKKGESDTQCPADQEIMFILDHLPSIKAGIIKGARIPVYLEFEFVIPEI